MAHIVRPSTWTKPELVELFDWHLADASPSPEESILASELTGEAAAAPTRFRVWVPSHRKPGTAYRVRVLFHRPRAGAPLGYVTAVHELHGCEAHDAGKRCWHLDLALAAIVRDFGHLLPNGGRVSEPSRHVHRAAPAPEPRIPPTAVAGFYE